RFPEFGHMLPSWLHDALIPNDKTNLGPYRLLHFIIVTLFVTRFLPKQSRLLNWPIFKPLIICGEQSLAVFCAGVFLSFAGRLALITSSGSFAEQILVSISGIVIM